MMMDSSHHMMFLKILVIISLVYADVIREDGYNNYEGQFTVRHKGRMLRVLTYLRNVQQELCALRCVQHLRCRTYNYHHGKKDCQLTDEECDEINADTITIGWYNYGTPRKVDGGWSSWRNFTECTKTCGNGTLEQWRGCDSPEPEHGGDDCKGRIRRRVKCNTHGCPVDGNWSSWRNSTNCTKTCGNGTLVQVRDCDSPKPENGGEDCKGVNKKTVECNTRECPADGRWSSWRNNTKCTKWCGGGTLDQERDCDSPQSEIGGAGCTGAKKRTIKCNTHECPVDGGWSSWIDSGPCTKACGSGGGTLVRRRECNSPKPEYGGAGCKGLHEKTVTCNTLCRIVNVALRKTAKQSSTFGNFMGKGAFKAIDGSFYTKSETNFENNPWWEVDLGKVYPILNIRLKYVNRQVLLVYTRKDEKSGSKLCKSLGNRIPTVNTFQCDKETEIRFVRISTNTKNFLNIFEVEIYSYEYN